MRPVVLLWVLVGCLGLCRGAEFMVVDGGVLTPATTLEVRFEAALVGADSVGLKVTGDAVPVVVSPGLDGSFTWLSTRSGVLVPGKTPELGRRYRVAVRGGLKGADGRAVNEPAELGLATPEFGVCDSSGYAGPNARMKVAFNREVVLGSLEGKVRFVNSDGRSLAAELSRPRDWNTIDREAEDWEWRWRVAREGGAIVGKPLDNRVEIRPSGMLTPGGEWSLEIGAGVKSVRGDAVTARVWTKKLGKVEPMVVEQVTPISYLNSGRSVSVRFSHSLGPDVTAETAGNFVSVVPAVEGGLRFEEGWQTLVLRGGFELGVDYQVVVEASLLSEQGLGVSGELAKGFRFKPIEPRVYLPEITGHQIRGGRRKLPVSSVNLRSVRVVARRVAAEDVPAAVEAFEEYHKKWDRDNPDEDYQALEQGAIRGELLYDEVVVPGGEAGVIDGRQTTVLDWDEVLGEGVAGTVFITVEGEPMEGATAQRVGAQVLLQLTDFGVLWKKYGERLRVTVFSMASGAPVEGVDVGLLDVGMERLGGGTSGADGTLWLDLELREPGWLTVGKGDDVHALRMGVGAKRLPTAAFGLPMGWVSWDPGDVENPQGRVTLFTDRPLYRPGETVKVKGIVRRLEDGALDFEAGTKGKLTLRLPRDRGEKVVEVRTDASGAFDAEVVLDPVMTGEYWLEVQIDGVDVGWRGSSVSLLAADFQPNAFDVVVETPGRGVGGEGFQAGVKGKYFFGSPTGGAKVVWTLQGGPSWFGGDGWWNFRFGGESDPGDQGVTLRGEGKLSAGGGLVIEPELPEVLGQPWRGKLTVEVTDENQQTVSAGGEFTRDASDFYVGIAELGRNVFGAGELLEVKAVVVSGATKKPLATAVEVSAELVRRRFETVRVKGAGNAISFRTETVDEVVAVQQGSTLVPEWDGDEWLVKGGASATFSPEEAGSYLVRVTAEDGGGRATEAVTSFEVGARDAELSWDYRHPAQVVMTPDKKEYVAGETAKVLVKTPFGGEALVTVERGTELLRSQRVVLEGNAPVIEIPVGVGDAPNVFVSMVLVRGADESTRKFPVPEYRYGMCQLRVVDVASKLAVRVFPRRAVVEPGDEVEVEVRVRDGNGEPVEDAEVTLFAVDDGILAITGYSRPEPWGNFHRPVALEVATGLTLFELMEEDPAALKYGNK
ncbi:MAG: MG2 domain-containing protein, partial [Verrucomicrobiales bacterium]|nr:MG2 domain-containing protein [Verrucomicrobiales bacterium]